MTTTASITIQMEEEVNKLEVKVIGVYYLVT